MKEDSGEKKASRRKLSVDQARALRKALGFEEDWFNGDFIPPLQGYRFVSIDMDWSQRHLAVTANVRCRRINDAERAVATYLPKMLDENKPVQCSIGCTGNGSQLFFFLFGQQGLMLHTVPDQQITKTISEICSAVDAQPKLITLSDTEFAGICMYDIDKMLNFLVQCKIDTESFEVMKSVIIASSAWHFDYHSSFGLTARKTTLENICQEILSNGYTFDEIQKTLYTLQNKQLQ